MFLLLLKHMIFNNFRFTFLLPMEYGDKSSNPIAIFPP